MNIYEKLVEIKKDIKGFNKDTKGFGFEYVSGSQVLRAVRDKISSYERNIEYYKDILRLIEILEDKYRILGSEGK